MSPERDLIHKRGVSNRMNQQTNKSFDSRNNLDSNAKSKVGILGNMVRLEKE